MNLKNYLYVLLIVKTSCEPWEICTDNLPINLKNSITLEKINNVAGKLLKTFDCKNFKIINFTEKFVVTTDYIDAYLPIQREKRKELEDINNAKEENLKTDQRNIEEILNNFLKMKLKNDSLGISLINDRNYSSNSKEVEFNDNKYRRNFK